MSEADFLTNDEQPRRGRQPRIEATQEERRRRSSAQTLDPTLDRFGVDASFLDHDTYVYRAAEDRGMRLHNLTKRDDWDFVTKGGEKASSADGAGVIRYQSGIVDGKPVYSYLLRKLKRYADADRMEKVSKIVSDQKARLTQGKTDESDLAGVAYVPKT